MRRASLGLIAWMTWWLAWIGAAAAQPTAGPVVPRLEASNDVLVLSRLPPILEHDEVSLHLRSGLTTTLALRLEVRGDAGKRQGGALVTVRFDLWDEVYHVAKLGASGAAERRSFDSPAALRSWWRDLRLVVLSSPAGGPPRWREPRLSIEVVPFSAAEARDTQRWLSDTLDEAKRSSAEGSSVDEDGDTLGRTFRLMMATSIQRRPLHVFHYEPEIDPGVAR